MGIIANSLHFSGSHGYHGDEGHIIKVEEKTPPSEIDKEASKWCKLIFENGDREARKLVKAHYSNPEEALKDLEKIKALKICGKDLEAIPEGLSLLKNLTILDLCSNKLKTFPEGKEIKKLTKLRSLILNGNPIESLPDYVINQEMNNLRSISLYRTKIKEIPYSCKNIIESYPATVAFT
ncbi:hypothetical protein DB42_DD00030 [Neochlamydia sp. EPS4]|uniref:leucine-rich repeat domain-containing protein n=1 Tax=Neochlamydia sp. EPS4 TaxID=1478175 RepID=UPI0005823B5C|nr:leucine-rich repeat domain-containing protein [Neochlamydia sp. EPS4]KIC72418.1 hypothetical protein DB42_DD00030 [Neochlamydia sp. EPS4]